MRILVTGGAGFIGSHITEHFATHEDFEVNIIDNFFTGRRENIAHLPVNIFEGDVLDNEVLDKALEGVDYVFHLAGRVSVPESIENPILYVTINTAGTVNVLQRASKAGVKKVIFTSSASIYGNNPTLPKSETMNPEPLSPYAVSKLSGEQHMETLSDSLGVKTTSLRYFNVFGPRQNPKSKATYAAAVPMFIMRALHNQDITIYGDGSQTRDYIYVKDIAHANEVAMKSGEGIYNVGRGDTISINELAHQIVKLTNSSSKILYADDRPGDIKHSCSDISRLSALGFDPKYPWKQGLKETIDYYIEHFYEK